MPFIPEFDARRVEVRDVAFAERWYREASARIDVLAEMRYFAILDAVAHGRSRREVSAATGLSVARIQQLFKQGTEKRAMLDRRVRLQDARAPAMPADDIPF